MACLCVLLIIFMYLLFTMDGDEGLTNKPTDAEKQGYIDDIINNKSFFSNKKTYYAAKEKLPWLDAIIYEDVRYLVRQNNLNKNSLNSVFY